MVTRRARGFTYLTVLFIVAILMAGLALVGEMWETAAKREREAELLFIGNQYRRAITLYYDSTPGVVKTYPRTFEDLLKDPRQPSAQRHLRRLYPDPLGGKEWGIVKGPDSGIRGVYSLSEEAPLKIAGFKLRDAGFDSAARYADWKFIHTPAAAPAAGAKPAAGATPAPGATPAATDAAPRAPVTDGSNH
jgi:type II secretory pathway pseudopilin PulG